MKSLVIIFKRIAGFFALRSYLFLKLLRAFCTILIIAVLSFVMIHASGNPAQIFLGSEATPDAVASFNERWGLDKPLIVQFKIYFERISHGDLGISVYKNKPVRDIIAGRFGATLSLMIPAAIISILLGVIIGTGSAIKHGKPVDRIILIGSTLGFSLPNFFLGVLLIFTFSVGLGILPSSGNTTARHYAMPLATLVISEIAVFTRFTRASMIDILQRYYVISFRSLGIKERRILFFQALPNAAIALLTIAGFYIGSLVGGAIITETIFSWPGIGSLLIEAIRSRDFPLVQGLILLFGVSIVIINLLVDIANSLIDPRVRKGAL